MAGDRSHREATTYGDRTVRLATPRGSVETRYNLVSGAVWVHGNLDTPTLGLFPDLGRTLRDRGRAGLGVRIRAVTTLATQVGGTDSVARLGPRRPILLLPGTGGAVLPPTCSQHGFRQGREPTRLIVHAGAGHGLDEVAGTICWEAAGRLVAHLAAPPRSKP